MVDLIPADAVRDMLRRGFNRPEEEIEAALAALPRALRIDNPSTVDAVEQVRAAFDALTRAEIGRRQLLDLMFPGTPPDGMGREEIAALNEDREREAIDAGTGALVDLGRAIVYALAAVSRGTERKAL